MGRKMKLTVLTKPGEVHNKGDKIAQIGYSYGYFLTYGVEWFRISCFLEIWWPKFENRQCFPRDGLELVSKH
jgi:hypothetical protein